MELTLDLTSSQFLFFIKITLLFFFNELWFSVFFLSVADSSKGVTERSFLCFCKPYTIAHYPDAGADKNHLLLSVSSATI
jgi:hypothetical protein